MRILQRHVAKEILVPFALAFLIMTFLTLVGDLLHELARRFMNKGLSLGDMCLMILYALPTLATYTIPIALLFATLVAFWEVHVTKPLPILGEPEHIIAINHNLKQGGSS